MSETKRSTEFNEKSHILDTHKAVLAQQGSPTSLQDSYNLDTDLILQNGKGVYTTGFPFACFNYINSIVGSGVIGISYALHQAGFGMGSLLLLFVAWITDYSLILMVRSAHLSGSFSYQGLMQAAFGAPGYYLLTALQFIYPFLAMISYNIVMGDTVTKVLIRAFNLAPDSLLAQRNFVVLLATICVTIPLCLFRDMAKLAKASLVSLIFVLFIMCAILLRLFTLNEIPVTENAYTFSNADFVPAIGIMAFAFMCHHNVFLLYESIKDINQQLWDKITHYSVVVAFFVTLSFGVIGYITFTGYVQGCIHSSATSFHPTCYKLSEARRRFSIFQS